MSVTNTIRDNVIYKDETGEWIEEELTNEDIEQKLVGEKKKAFLSFAYGVWVTAYARDNLLRRVIELDDYICYCDTDSCKLVLGYDKSVFEKYNKSVEEKIKFVANSLKIDVDKYQPKDVKGEKHLLGVFESESEKNRDHTYDEFITQGAKKYAVKIDDKIKITVAGVPKNGAKAIKDLNEFRDDLIFEHSVTNKNLLIYVENQQDFNLVDYLGNEYCVKDKTGCCIVPTTYVLGKSEEYSSLLTDSSSKRAVYKE